MSKPFTLDFSKQKDDEAAHLPVIKQTKIRKRKEVKDSYIDSDTEIDAQNSFVLLQADIKHLPDEVMRLIRNSVITSAKENAGVYEIYLKGKIVIRIKDLLGKQRYKITEGKKVLVVSPDY